jgi:hypothetical protein
MNPTAIFSKSGKGVQEASGKTSVLSRTDRAVLSAIDGRATLGDVAVKCGKQFDNEFRSLVNKLDKDGFIREVSPGAAGPAPKSGAAPAKPAPSKPTAPMDIGSDLDFTAAMAVPKKGPAAPPPQTVARAPAPPPKPTVAVPPKPPPPSAAEQVKQAQIAKEQQSAFAKAREEAERKQQEDRDRVKSEAEAKVRAETESRLRADAEDKAKADAEAKAKKAEADAATARSAAIRAAAEAKVKAEAEAKRAREEAERAKEEAERARREAEEKAERARKEAEEKAERARREAEEKARREQEELKRKLEEERRAREEAERKAKEEAERARRELEEERRKLEAERKAREEEAEQQSRRQRAEEEERERAEKEAARKREADEQSFEKLMAAQAAPPAAPAPAAPPPPPKAKAATGDAFADSLLADLDSFTQRDDDERKAKEEAERKAKEEIARRKEEEAEAQEREAAEVRQRMETERRRKEEEAQRVRDEEERRVRKQREEHEQAEREAEERRRKVAAATGAAAAGGDDIGITDDDLELDEVKREAALLDKKKDRKEEREKEREKERVQKKEREREAKSKKEKEREEKEAKKSAAAYRPRRKSNFGRNAAVGLFLLLIIGAGVVHVMPVSTTEYERAATEALGLPVKIASGRFSMIGGVQYKFEGVSIGDLSVPLVRAYPEIGSVFSDRKVFTRVELEGMSLPQEVLGDALFAKAKGDGLSVSQVTLKNLKLSGPLPLPPLDADVQLDSGGSMRTATLRGPEGLVAKLTAKEQAIEFDVNTAQLTLPFAQGITLVQFAMKGNATRQGMKISQWDGLLFSGHVTGTANLRWGNTWSIDGVMTARGVNAAVFAPALMSNGRAEGTGRFSMSGVEPAKLGSSGRLEGSFTVSKGVLGSFDLSRALQTGGRQVTGQTQFAEMSGQGTYDRGAVSLRNINLGAGALNAGASADISESGALSGRIVADVKTPTQNLRSTLILGGTVQEPQVRN